jgi:phosphatidate cytidylyltransferase
MKTRTITAFFLVLFIVPPFIYGEWMLFVLLGLLTMAATYELDHIMSKGRSSLFQKFIFIALSITLYSGIAQHMPYEWILAFIIGVLLIGSFVFIFDEEADFNFVGRMLFSILYPAIGFALILGLRDEGLKAVGFLFFITISTDMFAYFIGVKYGKHKIAPSISPKKSVEGSIGGIVAAILFTTPYVYVVGLTSIGAIELNIFVTILLIFGLSIIAQIGDLLASKIKRLSNVKDFSNIFPGHGGVMDRFDSVLFAILFLGFLSLAVGII